MADIPALLQLYITMLKEEAELARKAKEKDSVRGKAIIPDYDSVHPSADGDPIVAWLREKSMRSRL